MLALIQKCNLYYLSQSHMLRAVYRLPDTSLPHSRAHIIINLTRNKVVMCLLTTEILLPSTIMYICHHTTVTLAAHPQDCLQSSAAHQNVTMLNRPGRKAFAAEQSGIMGSCWPEYAPWSRKNHAEFDKSNSHPRPTDEPPPAETTTAVTSWAIGNLHHHCCKPQGISRDQLQYHHPIVTSPQPRA
jgi:hypothetical protein